MRAQPRQFLGDVDANRISRRFVDRAFLQRLARDRLRRVAGVERLLDGRVNLLLDVLGRRNFRISHWCHSLNERLDRRVESRRIVRMDRVEHRALVRLDLLEPGHCRRVRRITAHRCRTVLGHHTVFARAHHDPLVDRFVRALEQRHACMLIGALVD